MAISAVNKPRRKKQRKEPVPVLPLGDSQATHAYEHKDDEERRLESVLFGTPLAGGSSSHAPQSTSPADTSMKHLLDDELFFDDSAPTPATFQPPTAEDGDEDEDEGNTAHPPEAVAPSSTSVSCKKAAWVDPDDNHLDISIASDRRLRKLRNSAAEDTLSGREYEGRLRRQFEKVHPVPQWAASRPKRTRRPSQSASSDSDPDSEEGPVEDPTTGPIDVAAAPLDALPPTELAITRLRDANQAARSDGPVNAIQFHPSARVPVLMVAGADKRIRLFNIDGLTNPLLQTLHTPTLPPNNATFHPSGTSVLLSGPRPFVCVYDLQSARVSTHQVSGRAQPNAKVDTQDRACDINAFSPDGRTLAIVGRQGRVRLLDWSSVSVVGEIKAAAAVKSVWWSTGNGADTAGAEMYTLDANAEVCAWDARMRRCLRRWRDDGGYGTTMATECRGQYTAVGSKSGIVNVYDARATRALPNSAPTPLKTLPHLTTAITSLRFNHDAQILASASKTKKDQLKLVSAMRSQLCSVCILLDVYPTLPPSPIITIANAIIRPGLTPIPPLPPFALQVHTKTLTTFANWPTSGTPLGHVTTMDFSTGSEYLAIGNTRGTVLLYNLRHYAVAR